MSDGSQLFDPRDRDEADGTDGAEEIDHGAPALPLRAPSNDLAEPEGGLLMAGPLDPDAVSTPRPTTPETVPKAQAGRALVPTDLASPGHGMGEKLVALAYRFGVPGELLGGPPGRKDAQRLRSDVVPPPLGRRPAGMALRAGHFLVGGVKAPIGKVDLESRARLTPLFEQVIHGFAWLDDLAAAGTPDQTSPTARRIFDRWLAANPKPGRGPAWKVDRAGARLLAWLTHAPLLAGDREGEDGDRLIEAIRRHARWLDRHVTRDADPMAAFTGWAALAAAGLLLPEGRARRLFAEAGLVRAGGNLVSEDGGVLSRSPIAQGQAIATLARLFAAYRAVKRDPPEALERLNALLVPPLLALRHADGGLGSWQGGGGTGADEVDALVAASGVRARALVDVREWGYQRVRAGGTILQFDAAPPPTGRHVRHGCASTLAFELSTGAGRLIVNCGGAGLAGGQVPVRIEQGLRATAAHSTLVLSDANSTAIEMGGRLGDGVAEVSIDRSAPADLAGRPGGTRLEASHDGYAARHGLRHRRILTVSNGGGEVAGEDLLEPAGKRGKRGQIGFALRFHLGPGVAVALGEDGRGASLSLPGGADEEHWQFRLAGSNDAASLSVEESLWVDGDGRPHPIEQLVVEGLAQRGGARFSWLLKRID